MLQYTFYHGSRSLTTLFQAQSLPYTRCSRVHAFACEPACPWASACSLPFPASQMQLSNKMTRLQGTSPSVSSRRRSQRARFRPHLCRYSVCSCPVAVHPRVHHPLTPTLDLPVVSQPSAPHAHPTVAPSCRPARLPARRACGPVPVRGCPFRHRPTRTQRWRPPYPSHQGCPRRYGERTP